MSAPIIEKSDYLPLGCIRTGLLDRPDAPQEQRDRERAADRIVYSEVLSTHKWTPEDFERAKRFGFPDPISRYYSGKHKGECIYSRRAIADWAAEIRVIAKQLPE